jgi:hypothetical protein
MAGETNRDAKAMALMAIIANSRRLLQDARIHSVLQTPRSAIGPGSVETNVANGEPGSPWPMSAKAQNWSLCRDYHAVEVAPELGPEHEPACPLEEPVASLRTSGTQTLSASTSGLSGGGSGSITTVRL